MRKLEGLKPERVMHFFEDICSIPHGSGNTDKISDYCVAFAKEQGLEYRRDGLNNVIIKKDASAGYEEKPAIILQGHLDMVCEKEQDCDIDFLTDGLCITHNGEYISADGTTLGADDGIAVAMVLAILEDNSLPHPAIEAVFTTDEETGMYGAEGLDVSDLKARALINIDSENEGVLTVSCAGGARAEINIPLTGEKQIAKCVKVTLCGLQGGHSGVEIDKGRLNANTTMGKFLKALGSDVRIADIKGGLKDNAIPVSCECLLHTEQDIKTVAKVFMRENYIATDPGLTITVGDGKVDAEVYNTETSRKIVNFLRTVPNGITAMSQNIKGLVETSLNLGILYCENDFLKASFAVRSSVNDSKTELLKKLGSVAEEFGGSCSSHGHYPAWEYKADSVLRDTMVATYEKLYNEKPVVEAIHAGLECGLFCDKIAGLDAVSFGPDMCDIHTPRERISIESIARTYDYLCAVLKAL